MDAAIAKKVQNTRDISHLSLCLQQEYLACMGLVSLAKNHGVLFVAFITLWVNTIGFVYNTSLFQKFGISYIDFATSSDFLLAAIQNPYVLGYVIVTVSGYAVYFLIITQIKPRPITVAKNRLRILYMKINNFFDYFAKLIPFYGPIGTFILVTIMLPYSIGTYTVAPGQQTRPVAVHCEMYRNGKRETVKIQGHIVSSTSTIYLIDPPSGSEFEGQPVSIVPRSCVKRIDIPVT